METRLKNIFQIYCFLCDQKSIEDLQSTRHILILKKSNFVILGFRSNVVKTIN